VFYVAQLLPATAAVTVLLTADVVLVKHFFGSSKTPGEYSAVAALGRAVYWGALGVSGTLFPKMVFHETLQKRSWPLLLGSIALTAVGGALAWAIFASQGVRLLTLFAGHSYIPGASYLGLYAVGMTLMGVAVVLISANQSRGRMSYLWILLPAALAEPVLISQFHATPAQVVIVLDLCMAALVIGMIGVYTVHSRLALHRS
jgi:hypothetical protein